MGVSEISSGALTPGRMALISPLADISIAEDCPVPVIAARVRSSRSADPTVRFASGWGATPEEAAKRCVLEAAERYSAQLFGTERLCRARRDQVDLALAPNDIMLIANCQYTGRRRWNAVHPGLNKLPAAWRPDWRIDWIAPTQGLSTCAAWIPAGLCFLGHERDRRAGLVQADSSGVASGTSVADAAVRAFLELVERDAVAIWWYNRIPRPCLRAEDLGEPLVTAYQAWSASRGRVLRLLDLTHDFGLAVVAAVTHTDAGGSIALGFGAGASLAAAARHAVGEASQFESNLRLIENHVERSGASELTAEARALWRWYRSATLADHAHLSGTRSEPLVRVETHLDLARCHELCRERDLRFLALDLSRPSVKVPVVRVVVPGLRPMWARFAPGRLFDIPVAMGWRLEPATGETLNHEPLMF